MRCRTGWRLRLPLDRSRSSWSIFRYWASPGCSSLTNKCEIFIKVFRGSKWVRCGWGHLMTRVTTLRHFSPAPSSLHLRRQDEAAAVLGCFCSSNRLDSLFPLQGQRLHQRKLSDPHQGRLPLRVNAKEGRHRTHVNGGNENRLELLAWSGIRNERERMCLNQNDVACLQAWRF